VHRAFALLGFLVAVCFASFTLAPFPGLGGLWGAYAASGALLPAATWSFFSRFFGREHALVRQTRLFWTLSVLGVGVYLVVDPLLPAAEAGGSAPDVLLGIATLAAFVATFQRLRREHEQADTHVQRVRIRSLGALLLLATAITALEQLVRTLGPVGPAPGAGLLQRALSAQGSLPPMGALLGSLFIYVLHLVVQLYRLVDVNELLARLFVLLSGALLIVGTQGVFLGLAGDLRAHPLHGAFQLLLAALAFLAVQGPLTTALERIAGDLLNRPGRRLLLAMREVDGGLPRAISLDQLSDQLLSPLVASGRVRLASLYLWDQGQGSYRLHQSRGSVTRPLLWAVGPSAFVDALRTAGSGLQRSPGQGELGADLAAVRTLDAMDADLCLPFRSGGLVLGWLNLKAEVGSEGFSRDERRQLRALVGRASVMLQNIHSFRAMEEQQRLAALGTMAAGLAHEIRNPLAGIKGAAQYLQTGADDVDPDELRDFLGVIVAETDRLAGVVTQFLDYSRPYVIHAEELDPGALVRAVVELRAQGGLPPGVSLRAEGSGALPPLRADADKLRQVLLNLINNAIDASRGGGPVVVRARAVQIERAGEEAAPQVELSVEDSGAGVPEAEAARLFTPFFTTKPHGTGLGLAISRRLVEAHGGELRLRSFGGPGACFQVLLPVRPLDHRPDEAVQGRESP